MGIAIEDIDLTSTNMLGDVSMQEDLPVTTSIYNLTSSEPMYNPAGYNATSNYNGYNSQWGNNSGSYNSPSTDGPAWRSKRPEDWNTEEVTLFICSLMQSPTGTITPIAISLYLNLRGVDLCSMNLCQMSERDPENGGRVYAALQELLMMNASSDMEQSQSSSYARIALPNRDFAEPNNFYSIDVDDKFASILSLTENRDSIRFQRPAPIFMNNNMQGQSFLHVNRQPEPMYPHPHTVPISPPISPSSSCSEGSQSPPYSNMYPMYPYGYDDMGGNQGNHLWEFIRDLLLDSRYNPSIIKWEDREEGTFKFVKSDQVAKLWGRKKNNHAMTYEKLSRAMRYYYKRKILERIDGRRLVYKFGPAATGWKP